MPPRDITGGPRGMARRVPRDGGLFESRHGAGSVPAFLDEYDAFVPRLRGTARQLFGRCLENALARAPAGRARRGTGVRAPRGRGVRGGGPVHSLRRHARSPHRGGGRDSDPGVVDDAHLLDEASVEAIPFIARRLWIDGSRW